MMMILDRFYELVRNDTNDSNDLCDAIGGDDATASFWRFRS